jgi:hypothetical protein
MTFTDRDLLCNSAGACMTVSSQIDCDDCGPAVILTMVRIHSSNPPDTQRVIRNKIQNLAPGPMSVGKFVTSPAALKEVLQNNLPGEAYAIYGDLSLQAASKTIVRSLIAGKPAAILAEKCGHWMVVSGFQFSGSIAANSPALASIVLRGFNIGNPSNPGVNCGGAIGGGAPAAGGPVNRAMLQSIGGAGWKGEFTECPTIKAALGGGFVSVASADLGEEVHIQFDEQPVSVPVGPLDEETVRNLARTGLDFLEVGSWLAFRALPAWDWGRVARVNRSDQEGRFYYLVEMVAEVGTVGVVNLDGSSGTLTSVNVFSEANTYEFPDVRQNDAIKSHIVKRIHSEIDDVGGSAIQTSFVWEPTERSFDPIFPFFRIESPMQVDLVSTSGYVYSDFSDF